MTTKRKKTNPTWVDVKAKFTNFDRAGLLGLVKDLYAAKNQTGQGRIVFPRMSRRLVDIAIAQQRVTVLAAAGPSAASAAHWRPVRLIR